MQRAWQPILIFLAAASAILSGVAAERAAAEQPAGAETIEKWIEQLDSNKYIERERATIALERVGGAAIAALAMAADGDRLEVATRAVRVLRKYSKDEDARLSLAALETIASLKNRRVERKAAEETLGAMREENALAEILRLGGADDDRYSLGGFAPQLHLKLGGKWKGGDEGLAHIGHLRSLQTLNIHDTPVGDKGLEHLKGLKTLVSVELFGTRVTSAGADALRKAVPYVKVVHHRVFLGVKGSRVVQVAEISEVVPGSTAEKAGIRAGDVITKFDGQRVTDFLSLTNHIAGRKAGDKVVIELERGGEVVAKKITFDSQR